MKVLIIGLGSIAQKHIKAIREVHPDADIYALRSSKGAFAQTGIHNINTFDELPCKPDFVVISNPTQNHENSIKQTLKLGCPLFIEKPVLSNTENASVILKEINANNTFTYVACNLRFHPVIQFFKKYIFEVKPVINEVNIYCGSYLPEWRPGKNFREIYSANKKMGGGVHLDLIHEIDYCTWLFGKPKESISVRRNVSTLTIDAVDFAAYHLFYNSFTANITLNYYRKDSKREIEIITEDDTVKGDLLTCKVRSLYKNTVLFEKPFHMQETYTSQMKYFTDHIKNNQQSMNTFSEAVDVLKIALV